MATMLNVSIDPYKSKFLPQPLVNMLLLLVMLRSWLALVKSHFTLIVMLLID